MKVFLMHRDRDFDLECELPVNEAALTQDLELETLWKEMAAGDAFLFEIAKRALLSSSTDPDEILYRQQVLADCLEQPAVVLEIYELAIEALQNERRTGYFWRNDSPGRILFRSVEVLKLHVHVLRRLRQLADEHADEFASEGFTRFFAMVKKELADDYLDTVERHLRELEFKRGLLESVQVGKGNKGRNYVVRTPREQRWTERLPFGNRARSYSFQIHPRDESGLKALEAIRGRGINHVANSVAQSADHVKSFFSLLRAELAFYLGCRNVHERLSEKGEPTCFPVPVGPDGPAFTCRGLYDVCLTFHLERGVVGNDVDADGKSLLVITGANQGGKSTFLRSVGLAYLMLQSGMFVGAESFRADVCTGIFTHYKREEDAMMESGKLDEELSRMSEIADVIAPSCVLLCNESFASTNEREGSEIARQVVRGLLERRIKVFFVTHMYDLAHGFEAGGADTVIFLRAERLSDGRRSFRLVEGEPLPTSYGEDSFRRIFGTLTESTPALSDARA